MNRILTKLLLIIFALNSVVLFAQKEIIEFKDKDVKHQKGKLLSKGKGNSFDDLVKDMKKIPGLFTMYWDEDRDKVLRIESATEMESNDVVRMVTQHGFLCEDLPD